MASTNCEKNFAVDAQYCNFYANGDIEWSSDGRFMYCLNTTEVCVVDVSTGQVTQKYSLNESSTEKSGDAAANELELEEDVIYAFTLAANNEHMATAHRSGLLRLWSLESGQVEKLWKSQHKGPVVKLHFSPNCKLLCSSGADSTLRIWDFINSQCVCSLKDFPGPALLLHFHPHADTQQLYAVGADNSIYCWNYSTKTLMHQMRGHLSQVTGLSFVSNAADCPLMASVSRDKVLIIWQLSTGAQHKVIPMFEELEGVHYLSKDELLVACAKGGLKLVHGKKAKMTPLLADVTYEARQLLHCVRTQQWAVVTTEQNILIYEREDGSRGMSCVKQLIGFNDEILDMCYLHAEDRYLAVATNSRNLKLYDTTDNMNCRIFTGHTDTVLTLATPGGSDMLLSAGKDLTLLLWRLLPSTFDLQIVAKHACGHTASIGCVAFGQGLNSLCASVSQDGSLKVWRLQLGKDHVFQMKYSALAHDKEVNCVAFSPNNKLLATAAQDKTAKLWNADTQTAVGTLRGHSRGVWCVRFSPVDQIVLTSSSDCSLRLWSIASLSCLKRFEQECSILRADFIDHGRFIVAAGSDGLLKLWHIKTNACVQTLEAHSDRIWCLAISSRSQKHFYSGGADSRLIRWRDVTEQSRNEAIGKRQLALEQEQTLQSLLHEQRQLEKAFRLALTLGKPKTSYSIINKFLQRDDMPAVERMLGQLNADQRGALVEHVKAWCTNSRHCHVANMVLEHILMEILANPEQKLYNTKNLVETMTPYVERHFKRLTELQKDLGFLDFIVECISIQ